MTTRLRGANLAAAALHAVQAAAAHSRSHSDAYRAWAGLDAEHRLELIEKALHHAANDSAELPIAL